MTSTSSAGAPPPSVAQTLEQALAALKAGNLAEAEALYGAVPADDEKHTVALGMRGVIQGLRGDLAGAEQMLSAALAHDPGFAVGWYNLGMVCKRLGRGEQALASYDRALAIEPGFAAAHASRGIALSEFGCFEEALASLDRALAIRPDLADARCHRGFVLLKLRRFADAVAACDDALAAHPGQPQVEPHVEAQLHSNRGIALCEIDRYADAVGSFERGLALNPRYPEAWSNHGVALTKLRRFEEALASYAGALAIDPGYAEAHYNEAHLRLLMGDFERGFPKYEWRAKMKGAPVMPDFGKPWWSGEEDLAGRKIMLLGEQGFGDVIQFCRYAPLLAARGGTVILAVSARLKSLVASVGGASLVLGSQDALPQFDVCARLLSMPLAFKTRIDNIPATIPYLRPSDAVVPQWRERIGRGTRRKVGIVWAGSPHHRNDRHRSIGLRALLPAFVQAGVQLFSLQKDLRDGDAELLRGCGHITHLGDGLASFDDAAAAVSSLDLVVSVDTALAHLAGALGKPVWILLPFIADWRWLIDRPDSPWYPTARLFRQQRIGDWDAVTAQVAEELSPL
jgi:tetratricopeptide (TPR) repeat protein